jgi:SAM-dependent methyltransferase
LPLDPAWYRRRLYQSFLQKYKPASLLDVGCGGGWSVLDALLLGVNARGVEPVPNLAKHGSNLLSKNGYDPSLITVDGLSCLEKLPDSSEDCIVFLSVLPHVPSSEWSKVHSHISRILKPGGLFISTYRNQLFDLYTFNCFTLEFFNESLWSHECLPNDFACDSLDSLRSLISNPDLPGPYFTAAKDESFGKLARVKSNPHTFPSYLASFSINVDKLCFYHFHCVPPLLAHTVPDYRKLNHSLELNASDDWRAQYMCAIFMIAAIKN